MSTVGYDGSPIGGCGQKVIQGRQTGLLDIDYRGCKLVLYGVSAKSVPPMGCPLTMSASCSTCDTTTSPCTSSLVVSVLLGGSSSVLGSEDESLELLDSYSRGNGVGMSR